MENTAIVHVHAWISGRVQGVGYRFTTCQVASERGLSGWVRNLTDGRVEAVFEGPEAQVSAMLRWCEQGPETAIVKNVKIEYGQVEGLQGFETRRTI
ncbi:MAG: acylphosphatase [Leptolyngbyaceae cyanobacterium bins.59]|nr:acylphosphatase [Leptolyngbyaceae cyanobacterium bins.59]